VRKRLFLVLLLAVSSTAVAGARTQSPPGRAFRLIAFDYKQRFEDTDSYDAYLANLDRQIGAASASFRHDRPTLAFLPEDTGLMSWFVGLRGTAARLIAETARNSTAGIAALAPTYAPQIAYYEAKCPGIPAARALGLALSDTAWRAFGEGLAQIAKRYGIWVMANVNVGDVTVTHDPVKVAVLADPLEIARGYAYEAGCHEWNTAFLFKPTAQIAADGAADPAEVLAGEQKKIYLVPTERTQDVGLAFDSETPAGARAIVTPFARIGVLTSKDAWMPDVVERNEIDGMDVFTQPEAGAWAGHDESGLPNWAPDNMKRAVWSMVQWQAETSVGALADLTGNFGDLYFDGTATILRDARGSSSEYFLGRAPDPGLIARARWVFPDPPPGVAFGDIAKRRAILDAEGARLVPGSGDPMENGQLANFVVSDVELPSLAPSGARLAHGPVSRAVASVEAEQWAPSFAVGGNGDLHLVWTDMRGGFESPYTARSADGMTWSTPLKVGDSTFRAFDQQDNQYDGTVTASRGGLNAVWLDFRNQSWDVYGARSSDGGTSWQSSRRVDHSPGSGEGFPVENLDQDPAIITLPSGRLLAAWSDARGRRVDRGIVVSRSDDVGAMWIGDVPADGSGDLEADQWGPSLAADGDGNVTLAWQDQRLGFNQIYAARSTDGGETFAPAFRVAASSADQWQPAVAVAPDGSAAVAWSEGTGGGARRVRVAFWKKGRVARVVDADPRAPAGVRQARPRLAFSGGNFAVAWQDDRAGDWDVLVSTFGSGAPRVARADDGPPGAQARLPVLASFGGRLVVAWEDTRTGKSQIRTASLG
jgi:hypothetical protein